MWISFENFLKMGLFNLASNNLLPVKRKKMEKNVWFFYAGNVSLRLLVCLFCLFTPFLSVLFVFHRKSLVLLYLINRYMTSDEQMNNFWKKKKLWKVNFWYRWIIQCNPDSCWEHITGRVNVYLYGCVSLLAPVFAVCLCVCVRV